jgi:hypothetical protein
MNSALASLTETYTDSENEDNHISDDEETGSSHSEAPKEEQKIVEKKVQNNPKKSFRLVSYNDEGMHDDDYEDDEDGERGNNEDSFVDPDEKSAENDEKMEADSEHENKHAEYFKKYGFYLNPESKSKPNPKLQEMVTNITQKMIKNPDYDLNQYIQAEKKFRNPSIYDKLIQYCDINELGTNFPPETWDISVYGPDAYYEELAKAQKSEMDKLEKQKKENVKTSVNVIEGKRKSKWDVQDTKLVQTQATTTTGKSGTTVINAFGTLKKPKI